jgi:beta-lactamase regulating signal transducer with metallopeptidase domain
MNGWSIGYLSHTESMALGWTLLHFCWQGTAVALAYVLADRLTWRASAVARYAVATGALALMPLLVLATFAYELRTAPSAYARPSASREFTASLGSGVEDRLSQPDPALFISPAKAQGSWLANGSEQILPWLDVLWMIGVVLLAIRTIGGWHQLERLRRQASGTLPKPLERSFLRICERVQVGRRVMLRVSDQIISPMAMGVWRTTVILPVSAVLSLSTEELEAVLAHELGHIRRWDYAWNLLQTALETILFFHPAVWWLSRKVRERREVCCDEIAVQSCADPIVYAQTLLRLEEQKLYGLRLAVAQRGSGGSLLGRIKKVLGEDEPMEFRVTGGVRIAVASLVVCGLLLGPKVKNAVAATQTGADHVVRSNSNTASDGVDKRLTVSVAKTAPVIHAETAKVTAFVAPQIDVKTVETASVRVDAQVSTNFMMQAETKTEPKGVSYIDGMRDAGYPLDLNNDLNTLISLKSLGVTPEYAKQMAALGFGKPSVHELISLKALGVTPEYVAELKQSGLAPKDFHEVTTEKALGITPEYAAEMKKTGFGDMNLQELISLKAQNVTPEYIGWLKKQFPQITLHQLRQAAVFHLDDKFLAEAKSHGFDGTDLEKLLRLKISGLLDE